MTLHPHYQPQALCWCLRRAAERHCRLFLSIMSLWISSDTFTSARRCFIDSNSWIFFLMAFFFASHSASTSCELCWVGFFGAGWTLYPLWFGSASQEVVPAAWHDGGVFPGCTNGLMLVSSAFLHLEAGWVSTSVAVFWTHLTGEKESESDAMEGCWGCGVIDACTGWWSEKQGNETHWPY